MSLHSNLIKLATQPWTGNGVTSITTPVSSGISLSDTVNDVEIKNSGVRSLVTSGGSSGITLTGNANDVIIRNGGVHAITAGTAISLTAGPANHYEITNTGVTGLTAGSGITLSGRTGEVTVSASGGGSSPNPPVFVNNFDGQRTFVFCVKNTSYQLLSQTFRQTNIMLPTSDLNEGDWVEVIPLYQINLGITMQVYYNGVSAQSLAASQGNSNQRFYCVYARGLWNWVWNNTFYAYSPL